MKALLRRLMVIPLCFSAMLGVASHAQACIAARPYDPDSTIRGMSPDEIIASLPELVIEGTITGTPVAAPPIAPTAGSGTYFGDTESLTAEMRVDKVWKGKA